MNPALLNLAPASPEIFMLAMACVVLLVDLFIPARLRSVPYILTQVALLGCAVITVLVSSTDTEFAFRHMYVADTMGTVLKLMTFVAVSMLLAYSRTYLDLRGMLRGEYFVLVLFATLGMMVMISASHFLTLYLGLELLALCLYALVALQRDSATATEAAMKYFVLGALASGLLLYGMSLLYGASGSLELAKVANVIGKGFSDRNVVVFGVVFVVAGIAFKLGAVPFHMWVPDVYQGAPTPMALLIGSAPKLAAFAFIMRLLVTGLGPVSAYWADMLTVLAMLSLVIGNVTAVAQTNLKRMLAYSTISHMGFLLMGVLATGPTGYSSAMFYAITYVLTTLGAFGMILLLSRDGFEADTLDDFKGLNQRSPWYAFMMLLVMASMAGLPPTVGFFAKMLVFQAALDKGLIWLVILAVLMSVVGAFYYLRIIKLMYMDAPTDTAPIEPQLDTRVLLSANGLVLLALGILPQPLIMLCAFAIRQSVQG